MNQILTLWDQMDPRKRIIAILSVLAVVAAVYGLARAVNEPNYSLLYAGLDGQTSGEIVTSLEAAAVPFEVRGNAIYVDSSQRDQVRMSLASQGLPANGQAGYELLDGLSGFSTTSQMFDAAYWRAKEGELARTILASSNVRSARVHIANPVNRPFDRTTNPSASVIVTMGGELSGSQAKAMRFLVSSAVAGLEPDAVSVIDSVKGVILAAGSEPEKTPGEDISLRENSYRTNVERLLSARVGPGNAIVQVSIDANMDSEKISERVLDPDSRIAISTESEESTSSATGSGPASVTVASNLPDGDVEGGGGSSQSSSSETRQRSNFEVSEIRRERTKYPGEIRKISVAVLINEVETLAPDGTSTREERSPEELEQLTELVKSAVGYDQARGDVVTLQSLAFIPPVETGTLATAGVMGFFSANAMKLLQLGVLAIVALALGLGVLKPLLSAPAPAEAGGTLLAGDILEPGAVPGSPEQIAGGAELIEQDERRNESVEKLKQVITDRAEESTYVLENWLESAKPQQEQA